MKLPFAAGFDQPSFSSLLFERSPESHPANRLPRGGDGVAPLAHMIPHGTTILSFLYADGVFIAGDRLATAGHQVANRAIKKVYETDSHSAMAIAGAAGPAIEMAKLFRTELEHYEKIEGEILSLEGKANRLGAMIRQNLPMALQGLVVVPIFAGYDLTADRGRIFQYDVTGGRYEDTEFYATGSGGKDASNSLKKRYRRGMSEDDATAVAVEALFDAADEDRATGGPDMLRGIYPIVKVATKDGMRDVAEDRVRAAVDRILEDRKDQFGAA